MKNIITTTIIILSVLFSTTLFAQTNSYEKDQRVIVTMNNGAVYEGTVSNETDTELSLNTENANISLQKSELKKVELVNYEGDFLFRNSHGTRYFYSPTAIPLKKGEGYYQNMMLLANTANVGITDNISVGGGFEFISLIAGSPIFTVNTKFGIKVSDKLHLGAGVRTIGVQGEFFTTPYAVATLGTAETNVSIASGANINFIEGTNFSLGPTVISASHRVSNRISLMTENWIWGIDNKFAGEVFDTKAIHLGMHGARIHTRKSTFDFGVMTTNLLKDSPLGVNYIVPIPYVGYSYAFSLAKNKK